MVRSSILIGMAALLLSASAASAASGCRRRHNGLGSNRASLGINANDPSRAIFNPCSSDYDFGKNLRRREKREYPGAIVRH